MGSMDPARLGARQIEVLRAAKAGKLVRFDNDTWAIGSHACTPAGRSVAARDLLTPGRRTVRVTAGSWRQEPGCYMDLSSLGEVVVEAWERAHPEVLEAEAVRAARITALAAKPGPITVADVLSLAAEDETLPDSAYLALAEVLRDDEEQP